MLGFVALVPWLRTLDTRPAATSIARTLLNAWLMSVALTAAMYTWFGLGIARYLGVEGALGLAVLLLLAPVFQPQVWVFALVRHVVRHPARIPARIPARPPVPPGAWPGAGPLAAAPAAAVSPSADASAAPRRPRVALGALAGGAAWVATEWAVPKMLGDTLGHGLYPSPLLRQAADVFGAAGLTLLLLWANEALAAAWAVSIASWFPSAPLGPATSSAASATPVERRRGHVRAIAQPLALAVAVPLVLAAYGAASPTAAPEVAAPADQRVRMGLVQSNIVDYERLRRERGAGEVVREVLDVHYAMSYDAVERQKAQALLWSETVYPTTFGRPKSDAGSELDREIAGIVNAAGVPLVFGTYDRDAQAAGGAEYNAAAFLAPGTGLVGMYRKTRLFPFTEALPGWLEGLGLGPFVRGAMPWVGDWRRGDGARVFPLRLADGREVPVLPLICLDDVDTGLAIDGARLGATLILTMSNDSWFTEHPQGARLHLAVAAFRSIETRLPQFRVTSNGYSAVIDARGEVLAGTRMGERTLVVGELPAHEPPRTLMVAWGDWVGRAALAFLLGLAGVGAWRFWAARGGTGLRVGGAGAASGDQVSESAAADLVAGPRGGTVQPDGRDAAPRPVAVLSPGVRWTAAALRVLAGGGLLWIALAVLGGEGALATSTLAQVRAFVALVLAPEAAAHLLMWASRATLSVQGGLVVLSRGARRTELPVADVAAIAPWRVPLPMPGASLHLASGEVWEGALGRVDAIALQRALAAARGESGAAAHGGDGSQAPPAPHGPRPEPPRPPNVPVRPIWAALHAQARLAPRAPRMLQHPLGKFLGLPFLLAIPAYRLHQHIAFGGGLGELQLFGLAAFAKGFALWWAAWIIGVVIVAAALRALIELVTLVVLVARPANLLVARRLLEHLGLAALYLGVPGWLLLRFLGG